MMRELIIDDGSGHASVGSPENHGLEPPQTTQIDVECDPKSQPQKDPSATAEA